MEELLFIHVRKSLYQRLIATEEDRNNPNYSDPCVVAGGFVCTYCCVFTLGGGSCSRNIQVCDRVYERQFYYLEYMIGFLLTSVIGCPLLAFCLRCLIHKRCCKVMIFHFKLVLTESLFCNRRRDLCGAYRQNYVRMLP